MFSFSPEATLTAAPACGRIFLLTSKRARQPRRRWTGGVCHNLVIVDELVSLGVDDAGEALTLRTRLRDREELAHPAPLPRQHQPDLRHHHRRSSSGKCQLTSGWKELRDLWPYRLR